MALPARHHSLRSPLFLVQHAMSSSIANIQVPRLFHRHRLVLALLKAMPELDTRDLQNLLFIYCQTMDRAKPFFEFVPSETGPVSFTVLADLEKLRALDLLEQNDSWALTAYGQACVLEFSDHLQRVRAFKRRVDVSDSVRLSEYIAQRFPYYILNIQEKYRYEFNAKTPGEGALYTIGYEGRSVEQYLILLIENKVHRLCDVRRNPISRKFGFSKSVLREKCAQMGIEYSHLPKLGIASEYRRKLDTQEAYDALFQQYLTEWLPHQQDSLDQIRTWLDNGERVALTCFEEHASQCHRHCVAETIETDMSETVRVKNL